MDKIEYKWPINPKYQVVEHDKYGIRKNHYVLFKKREHSGFDITADFGTEVKSITSGIVLEVGFDGTIIEGKDFFNTGYGNKIEILSPDGRRILYGHLSMILVEKGQKVSNSTIIGKTGCSGGSRVPHLHIEIRKENTEKTGLEDTINPLDVLPPLNLEKLNKQFTQEPYAKLWKKMASNAPWDFDASDIPYAGDEKFIL